MMLWKMMTKVARKEHERTVPQADFARTRVGLFAHTMSANGYRSEKWETHSLRKTLRLSNMGGMKCKAP